MTPNQSSETMPEHGELIELRDCWTCRHNGWCEITHSSHHYPDKLYRCANCKAIYPEQALSARANAAEKEVERLKDEYVILTFSHGAATERAEASEARVRQLEEALEPFAKVADAFDYWMPEAMPDFQYPRPGTYTGMAMEDAPSALGALDEQDFRHARTLLSLCKEAGQ